MSSKWERYAAFGGFWFVLLSLVGSSLFGAPPNPDSSASELQEFFADHAGAIQASSLLYGLAAIGLLWWFGSLWRRMSAAEEERPRLAVVAALGLVWSGVFWVLSGALWSALALRVNELGDTSRVLYTLSGTVSAASNFGLFVFLAATVALTLRAGMFPRWTAYVGGLSALLFLVGTGGIASDAPFFLFVGGLVAYLVWLVWIVALSVVMWRPAQT